ncbi:hypothetical protein acsn021_29100 [Anaerocolumna cellulosilytica]|uniref:Uncharacterized protein n=1 Tax=Anaerocolumna cellulosilytica TaxID=433286 RepID=A0A6S6R8Q8_9FIRM|nr:S8 family peptidase [Anaerocolumna cellulosilytica]MBB5197128.1 subtilisin family serine protease [Anaerocolumna cellulosilytica]BCJ95341.1 hypothetical protein acsn021_29100 [Anaerocolumna cellulosilytica]
MTQEEKYKIISDDFIDLIIEYNRNEKLLNRYTNSTSHIINTRYAIAYVPASQLTDNFVYQYGYNTLPYCYGLTSEKSLEASGILKLRRVPSLNLRGKGVLIALVDTGIDYTNPIFRHADGSTRIVSLWDQTINSQNQYPEDTYFGTLYHSEQINQALSSTSPYDIVPSLDENGHGSMLAGIAAGSEVPASEFSGVAPDSELVIVKLKEAKPALRQFLMIPPDVPCYQENDILWGLDFVLKEARRLQRPMAICIGFGTSQGPHDGTGPLNNTLSFYADFPGISIVVAAGNEGNKRRHFFSQIDSAIGYSTVELNVGPNESGFFMELWGAMPNTYSIEIISPDGERSGRIEESIYANRKYDFIFSNTTLLVDYRIIETHTGEQLILFRFKHPVNGIWRFQVYTRGDLKGSYHIWLPMGNFISNNIYFLESTPYTTLTSPSDSFSPIAVTAYNPANNSLYLEASKGYTRTGTIKPELTAPGSNITVPILNQGFGDSSGTGLAAAHTAGIAALLMEWGIVKGFYKRLDSVEIKKLLIRGANRESSLKYPNRDWGYGIIDLYNVLNVIRGRFPDSF